MLWKNLAVISQLTDPAYLQSILAAAGIAPQRRASQNFLICAPVIEATVSAAQAGPKRVTELGAGVGVLTGALLAAGYTVRAIERDQRLAKLAVELIPENLRPQLMLVAKDLRYTPWEQDDAYQIVGNIPYHLSGLIIRKITQLRQAPEQVILLVQKEVGARLVAAPPELQLIGLAIHLWGEAHVLRHVPASCFWPAPQVDSSLVLLKPASIEQAVPLEQREAVLACARYFFSQRRKQMGGVLKRWRKIDEERTVQILQAAGVSPHQRPQEVKPAEWIRLANALTR